MPAPEPGHLPSPKRSPGFAQAGGAAWLEAAASPCFDLQHPPVPPQSRRDTMPAVSWLARSSRSGRPRNARKPPGRRQIPIGRTGRTGRTARPNPPAVSSLEACRTPADRVRRTRLYPAGVRQPFTQADYPATSPVRLTPKEQTFKVVSPKVRPKAVWQMLTSPRFTIGPVQWGSTARSHRLEYKPCQMRP